MRTITYFRHTFICPECENYNYRVTANPDPCISYASLDCGSCAKRIPMTTHHATDVCLPPVFDTDLICMSIFMASFIHHLDKDEIFSLNDMVNSAIGSFNSLEQELKKRKGE